MSSDKPRMVQISTSEAIAMRDDLGAPLPVEYGPEGSYWVDANELREYRALQSDGGVES